MLLMESFLVKLCGLTKTSFSFPSYPLLAACALIFLVFHLLSRRNRVYLVDFTCYKPPNCLRAPISTFIEHIERSNNFSQESIDFLSKIHSRSGIGNESCLPITLFQLPPNVSLTDSIEEVQTILFPMAEDFLLKNKINPKSIDILVVNCSIFCPTPSISSMFIKRMGLQSNIRSYNLTGMGCSAGLLSVSLAKDLLKIHKNSLALVVSLESLTHNGYPGKVKSMLLTNTLFRSGGTIILLSNHKQDRSRAKYVLQHLVRINMGFDDQSYTCVFQENDEEGHVGVSLSRRTMQIASNALRTNMVRLGPLVLPYSEKIRYLWSVIRQRICAEPKSKQYIPDFKKAFEHFCIHSGGRAVIDAVEDNLSLSEEDVEPSRMALYRFGNTSSSSVWYALCYLEAKGRVKRGDRVWQIAFGSGFKCNSAVWKCVSDVDPTCSLNPWSDRIHLYPAEVPEILDT